MKDLSLDLIRAEGWEIQSRGREDGVVIAYGKEFPIRHPFHIYSKLYKEEKNPELKYDFLKRMHDLLWPQEVATWNYWCERRFRTHCEGWRITSYASGASTGKSVDGAKLGLLEFLCSPKDTSVIVASTTIESLSSRIYGYIITYLKNAAVPLMYTLLRSNPQKVLYDRDDTIHCISAIAAAKGKDQSAISQYIGRHPKRKLVLLLDEGPDLDPIILEALPNLEAGQNEFQCIVIGNSNSYFDLHGALSTPLNGWGSVNPEKDFKWETKQKGGICLFFSCYESPAIHETDPEKKKKLSRFLITSEQIEEKKILYGEDSDKFYRFVLGYWKSTSTDGTVMSKEFLTEFQAFRKTEWSGFFPLKVVAGLDVAFASGTGDDCILRFAVLGYNTDGLLVLDFRYDELTFLIKISRLSSKSAEIQVADQVVALLNQYGVPIECLALDATGQGRAMGGVLQLKANSLKSPIKIYTTRSGANVGDAFDVIVKSSYDLWSDLKTFIQHGQIRGLDTLTINQLSQRLVVINKSGKPLLESKLDYKKRMGAVLPSLAHSPDHADAAALTVQSAIINYGFAVGRRKELPKAESMDHLKLIIHRHEKEEQETRRRVGHPRPTFKGMLGGGYRRLI